MADAAGYDLPLTQQDLAECMGMTGVHLNRILGALKADGVVSFQRRRVRFHDLERARSMAEFSPDYLFVEKRPR